MVDIALVDNLPTVLDVFKALESNFVIGNVWIEEEFESSDTSESGCHPPTR